VATAVALLFFFQRKGWLGRQDPRALREQSHLPDEDDD